MNIIEETLDSVVLRQSYVEETYETVSELLEHCKQLQRGLNSISGTFVVIISIFRHLMFRFPRNDSYQTSLEA
jgi:hypothetical protein